MGSEPARMLMGVNESSIKGYPHASISSRKAFDWTVEKIVRSNVTGYKILFLHVQVPDEDGFDDMDSIYASPEDFEKMKNRDKVRRLHLLEFSIGRCHQYRIPCEAWIKKGDPKQVICSEVKRVQPDLLVVRSRGLGPIQRKVETHFCPSDVAMFLRGMSSKSGLSFGPRVSGWLSHGHALPECLLHIVVDLGMSTAGRRFWVAEPTRAEPSDDASDGSDYGDHSKNDEDRPEGAFGVGRGSCRGWIRVCHQRLREGGHCWFGGWGVAFCVWVWLKAI